MESLIERDLRHIWHPCSQMKDFETEPPVVVTGAQGSELHLADGRRIIDAISSWWCKSLGHGHPRLKQALIEQAQRFEHVILGNTTHDNIVRLGEQLAQLSPGLTKSLWASDGSCAVEIALKMSLHTRVLQGQSRRTHLLALSNGYHGETTLALAVGDGDIYRQPYEAWLPEVTRISMLPYVCHRNDPLWQDCSAYWPAIEAQLAPHAERSTALIIEPILQGAAGMRFYSADLLRRLRQWATQYDVHLIADEVLTGLGRTGFPLACHHANIEPDFLCLAKGLTAGWVPLSVCLTSDKIYDMFYDDYSTGKSFLHSHTHSGNALGVAVALEVLQVLKEEKIYEKVQDHEALLFQYMQEIVHATGHVIQPRALGSVAAIDLDTLIPRMGYRIYQQALKRGALLRPLGNTIYWLPPLNMTPETLKRLRDITIDSIRDVFSI